MWSRAGEGVEEGQKYYFKGYLNMKWGKEVHPIE